MNLLAALVDNEKPASKRLQSFYLSLPQFAYAQILGKNAARKYLAVALADTNNSGIGIIFENSSYLPVTVPLAQLDFWNSKTLRVFASVPLKAYYQFDVVPTNPITLFNYSGSPNIDVRVYEA